MPPHPEGSGAPRPGRRPVVVSLSGLERLLAGGRFEYEVRSKEAPAARSARLAAEKVAAAHRRRMEWAVAGALAAIVAAALWIFVHPGYSDDRARWAATTLTATVAAGLGFLTGRATRPE